MASKDLFGSKLRDLRNAAKMTQKELARAVDFDHTYISKIETSRCKLPASIEFYLRLKSALNLSQDQFVELLTLAYPEVAHDVSGLEITAYDANVAQKLAQDFPELYEIALSITKLDKEPRAKYVKLFRKFLKIFIELLN